MNLHEIEEAEYRDGRAGPSPDPERHPMRILIDNAQLPGFTSERTINMGERNELARHDVFDADGDYQGQVVYVSRQLATGTSYGWRPAGKGRVKLTTKVEAVKRLDRVTGAIV